MNFWQPGGRTRFRALRPGELFLFKLHSPNNFIVGGGVFAQDEILPISLAWQTFEETNGARSLIEMRQRVGKYRSTPDNPFEDYEIGCRIVTHPIFLDETDWIPAPTSWSAHTQQGRIYDTDTTEGHELWEKINDRIARVGRIAGLSEQRPRYAEPTLIRPRLGQGAFRVAVTVAYGRQCGITHEKVLPILEAAHIRPYSLGGEHEVSNGVLLRQDIHTLFDLGYVTVDPDDKVVVSKRIKEEFDNGKNYYELHGRRLRTPENPALRPDRSSVVWHNENVYRS